jgi:hypothetical protein
MLKLAKLQSLARNVVKCGKYSVVLQISQGYIFLILQHFATKLCNFTNFNMLFLAVVMDFVLLA